MTIFGKLIYEKHGEPANVLAFATEHQVFSENPEHAHVRVLYSPIHQADMMTIRGFFPTTKPLPAVPGCEGVVEIISATNKEAATQFQPGDRAVVLDRNWGLWRQQGTIDPKLLYKIPPQLSLETAANLIMNPCTAYLMLHQIAKLQPGDVIIQNAANSSLGQIVIQLAKHAGLRTINVIRNRPDLEDTIGLLKTLGGDVVMTNEQLTNGLAKFCDLTRPKLALECVGGHLGADLAATLDNGATMIVYGALSGQPVDVRQEDLIFRNIRVIGFWFTKWRAEHTVEEFRELLDIIIGLYLNGKLKKPQVRKFKLSEWRQAIDHATRRHTNEKVLLHLDQSNDDDDNEK